jgi:hypothetical protein
MKLLYHNVFQHCHKPSTSVDVLPNVVECSSYILPVITNGNYYTGSNGTGTLLHAGDLIEKVEPIIFLAVLIQNLYQTI